MKYGIAILGALALAALPAEAQTCAEIKSASALADKGFPTLPTFSGAAACNASKRETSIGFNQEFECVYAYPTEAAARAAFTEVVKLTARCLTGWQGQPLGDMAHQFKLPGQEPIFMRWIDIGIGGAVGLPPNQIQYLVRTSHTG